MRLQAIKLAGFKSFVDPTLVSLPGNLNAIVGPNGCGKSNIIDAVRWVMGESSARSLRGESMSDVVFNGSATRRLLGRASIELMFDNSEGRIGGEYAGYREISIQRTLTRDGQSTYLLNGTRCRRRDVTDLLLGTGLGSRSCSIIEQGMISDLVESRPEDLRLYIEEAAGISRYKERRRETDRRIHHVRENLAQLDLLREELESRLSHLQRQAKAAERYQKLRAEQQQLNAQLLGIRCRDLMEQIQTIERRISQLELERESILTRRRSLDSQLDEHRSTHDESVRAADQVQGEFYGLGTQIARLEGDLRHSRQRISDLTKQLQEISSRGQQLELSLDADKIRLAGLTKQLAELQAGQAEAEKQNEAAGAGLNQAGAEMQAWRETWDAFSQRAAASVRQAEVAESRIRQLEISLERTRQRTHQLRAERDQLQAVDLSARLSSLEAQMADLRQKLDAAAGSMRARSEKIEACRNRMRSLEAELGTKRSRLHQVRGRHVSLETLQQAALGGDSQDRTDWLAENGMQNPARLAEVMEVAPEWELAVETVLGDQVQAIGVDAVDALAERLPPAGAGPLLLREKGGAEIGPGEDLLLSRVHCPWNLQSLLQGIHCVPDLAAAFAVRKTLAPGHSVVTPSGIWLGRDWLRVHGSGEESVLKRQRELGELAQLQETLQEETASLSALLEQESRLLPELEAQQNAAGEELLVQEQERSALEAELAATRQRWTRTGQDLQKVLLDLADSEAHLQADQKQLGESSDQLAAAKERMEGEEAERQQQLARRVQLQEQLAAARSRADQSRDRLHSLALEVQSVSDQVASTSAAMNRVEEQEESALTRRRLLDAELRQTRAPLQKQESELAALLESRSAVERRLTGLRHKVSEANEKIEESTRQLAKLDSEDAQLQQKLGDERMQWQDRETRRETLEEELQNAGFSLQQTLADLPEPASEHAWQSSLESLAARIQRLEPINLAAISEYETQSERKQYLDAQNEDLEKSLVTLQAAIQRMDGETRSRFKKTFEQINEALQQLFPKLFGGGEAWLQMLGDDPLDTGISFMARPPGKRNTSIHLLSGGEKALTAIALVFAVFSLNPAPFCLLDEVDAPLDDVNVRRYSEMVKEMSEKVQFIYVTHNKISMEMAQHLIGVTSQEPGVSRLVAVDLGEAVSLASA